MTAIARNTDPTTSHEAAAHVDAESLRGKALYVLSVERVPLTAREVAEAVLIGNPKLEVESVRKRVRELARLGLIEEAGSRECIYTGKNAMTFRVKVVVKQLELFQ